MSPDLPFDIIAIIIDIVGEDKDTYLLKELSLVSHCFYEICSKHLFAIVDLHGGSFWRRSRQASSKKGFVKLLINKPDVLKYIRKLKYNVEYYDDESDDLLSLIILNILPTFSCLHSLTITTSSRKWNEVNPSLTSALLYLMHLPTINHLHLSHIRNFPLSSLTQSVNLLRLDIQSLLSRIRPREEDASPEIVVEMIPKIREFDTLWSSRLTTKLLYAKTQDGRPAFNFMDLRRFSTRIAEFEDEQNIRYLLQKAKLLEKLELSVDRGQNLVGLLSPNVRTLKVLDLWVSLWDGTSIYLGGICEELEALAGHNMLEAFKLCVRMGSGDSIFTEGSIGSTLQKVENLLVKPGWSALRRVSFKVAILGRNRNAEKLCDALQSLPDKYLNHLSKLESVTFNYQAYLSCCPKCHFESPSVGC